MLSKFAAYSILGCLATAPPHLSAEFRLMGAARPIVVFVVLIFLTTVFAEQKIPVNTSSCL